MKTTTFLLNTRSGRKPVSFILQSRDLPTRRLLHFDGKRNRALRYSSNQQSPFIDEQDGEVILEAIIFKDGVLQVPDTKPELVNFLRLHPDFNSIFSEWDPAKEAEERINLENLILDAQIAARELSIEKMASIIRMFTNRNVDKMDAKEIKWECMQIAKAYPSDFLDAIDDPDLELDDIATRAIRDGFVSVRNGGRDIHYNLKDSKKRLMTVPLNEKPESAFAAWLQSDDGLDFFKYLRNHYDSE
jgi:hypothetical protein